MTRRRFLALSAALLAACQRRSPVAVTSTAATTLPAPTGDVELLLALVEIEEQAAAVYSVAGQPQFGEHHRAHAEAFRQALAAVGRRPPDAPAPTGSADAADLLAMEEALVARYLEACRSAGTAELAQAAANVMAVEARHAMVLRGSVDGAVLLLEGDPAAGDEAVVEAARSMEERVLAAYQAVVSSNKLTPSALELARAAEERHRLVLDFFTLHAPPPTSVPGRPVADENAALSTLTDAEEFALQAHYAAIPRIAAVELRTSLATVVAMEAQHVTAFLQLRGLDPVPRAFVAEGLD